MDIQIETRKLEELMWRNRPVYRLWGYNKLGEAEELFHSEQPSEIKTKMLEVINGDVDYGFKSYGLTLGAVENFDFYTFEPETKPEVDAELAKMERALSVNEYEIFAYKRADNDYIAKAIFKTSSFDELKDRMREIISATVKDTDRSEWDSYSITVNGSDCYEFETKK